jgi:hypothetical protein
MNWSYSMSRVFFQCPRKWYYRKVFADSHSTDFSRKEAFFLSELSNLRAWRGKLVDQVISRFIIPRTNVHDHLEKQEVLDYAKSLLSNQLEFGKAMNFRNGVSSEFRRGNDYCAFFELEYGSLITQELIQKYVDEINTSLTNLMNSEFMKRVSEDGLHMIAQRTLKMRFLGTSVNCTPDLIAFFKSSQPAIIDWKVETPQYKDHWLQLGLYGVVLSRVEPHKDFPAECCQVLKNPSNIELLEFQLLHNNLHQYKITQEDIIGLENYIYSSTTQISRLVVGDSIVDPHVLPGAVNAESCLSCNYKKLCWRKD